METIKSVDSTLIIPEGGIKLLNFAIFSENGKLYVREHTETYWRESTGQITLELPFDEVDEAFRYVQMLADQTVAPSHLADILEDVASQQY